MYFRGVALAILGIIMGVVGICYLQFRARRGVAHEFMLGATMAAIGWAMFLAGGLMMVFAP